MKIIGNGRLLDQANPANFMGYHFPTGTYVHPGYPQPGGRSGTFVTTQNTLLVEPICLAQFMTFDRILVEVTGAVAATTIRLGLYRLNKALYPTTLVSEYGTVDSSGIGYLTLTIATGLEPGWYGLAMVAQGGTPTCRSWAGIPIVAWPEPQIGGYDNAGPNRPNYIYALAGVVGALPNPFTAGQTMVPGGFSLFLRVLSVGG